MLNTPVKVSSLDQLHRLLGADMQEVDRLIRTRLQSDVPLINQLSTYIVAAGGKRLRPILSILAARACGYAGHGHLEAAAIIELVHTATLHDDVVDASRMRRGRETASFTTWC